MASPCRAHQPPASSGMLPPILGGSGSSRAARTDTSASQPDECVENPRADGIALAHGSASAVRRTEPARHGARAVLDARLRPHVARRGRHGVRVWARAASTRATAASSGCSSASSAATARPRRARLRRPVGAERRPRDRRRGVPRPRRRRLPLLPGPTRMPHAQQHRRARRPVPRGPRGGRRRDRRDGDRAHRAAARDRRGLRHQPHAGGRAPRRRDDRARLAGHRAAQPPARTAGAVCATSRRARRGSSRARPDADAPSRRLRRPSPAGTTRRAYARSRTPLRSRGRATGVAAAGSPRRSSSSHSRSSLRVRCSVLRCRPSARASRTTSGICSSR